MSAYRVLDDLRQELERVGFSAKGEATFAHPLSTATAVGWLALPHGSGSPERMHSLDPQVGVHSYAFDRISRIVLPTPVPNFQATVATNLGFTMPQNEYRWWDVGLHEPETRNTVREIVDAVVSYGIPYMEGLTSADRLIEAIREDPLGVEYRLPIALVSVERTAEAREIVSQELSFLGKEEGDWETFYREFASKLFLYLDALPARTVE
jgi:hypothetical protein